MRCSLGWVACVGPRKLLLFGLVSLAIVSLQIPSSFACADEVLTPEAAAAVLDLRTFPRLPDADEPQLVSLGTLMYEGPGTATEAFDFQKQHLTGWQEQPGGYHDPSNHSARFTKDGYSLSVSTSPILGDPAKTGWARVALVNHGNLPATALPVPQGMKPFTSFGGDAAYLTGQSVSATAAACRELLLSAGWEPYGTAGSEDSPLQYFKRGALRVMAWVSQAPAQENQTMLRYSTELLAADLPVPPDVPSMQYTDALKRLSFDYPGDSVTPLVTFYRERLAKQGWQPTTDRPVANENGRQQFLIFRNQQGDLISLDMEKYSEIVRTKLTHQSAAEVARETELAKAAAQQAAEEAAKKTASKQPPATPQLPGGIQMPDLPDSGDVDVGALINAAQKMADDAADGATGARKPAASGAATGPVSVADVPIPDGAGVEYTPLTKMITVTSPDDIPTLAAAFVATLTEQGWESTQRPLITPNSAIVKVSRGPSALTVMISEDGDGSRATVMSQGLKWDSVPRNRAAAKTAQRPATGTPSAAMPADNDSPLSFDIPTGDDEPDAPPVTRRYSGKIPATEQRQTGATISSGNQTQQLAYGIGYQALESDELITHVLLSTKPINVDKVIALLNSGSDGGDALGFDPQLKLRYAADGTLEYVFLYVDGISVNLGGQGDDKIEAQLTVTAVQARGVAKLRQPGKFFDKTYNFSAPFTVQLLTVTESSMGAEGEPPAAELAGEMSDGLPYPMTARNRSSEGSRFRKVITTEFAATLPAALEFYRRELTGLGWKENTQAAVIKETTAELSFSGSDGTLQAKLTSDSGQVTAQLTVRYPQRAQAAGVLPQSGKGRIILANAGDKEVTILINGQSYKVAAGRGAEDPSKGISLHVAPGGYTCTIKYPGQPDQIEKLKVAIGDSWGLIVGPGGGALPLQVY